MADGEFDLIVVGAGVVGVSHAAAAVRRGLRVALLEQNRWPSAASVRNFGLVIPSAMDVGPWQRRGLRSVAIYRDMLEATGGEINEKPTQYLASSAFEADLLRHLADDSELPMTWLGHSETIAANPLVNPQAVTASLLCDSDLRIEPRTVFPRWIEWLEQSGDCEYRPQTAVVRIESSGGTNRVRTASGEWVSGDRICVCNGHEQSLLFPEWFAAQDHRYCKLQMMRTVPQSDTILTSHVASPRSLRRYPAFRGAQFPDLPDRDFHAQLDRWGIHVWLAQDSAGRIVVGDSHEYSRNPPDDVMRYEIESAILEYARTLMRDVDWNIETRWYGVYLEHAQQPCTVATLGEGLHVVTALGGKGMTVSPGLAEEHIQSWWPDASL